MRPTPARASATPAWGGGGPADTAFRILGPVRAERASHPVPLPGGKQRTLLAALLARAGAGIPAGELVPYILSGGGPENPEAAVYTYVARLRSALARHAACPGLIRTTRAGYRADLGPDRLDLSAFRALVQRALRRVDRADLRGGAADLHDALALWRGPAADGLGSAAFRRAVAEPLEEEAVRALDRYLDVMAALGEGPDALAELRGMAAVHRGRGALGRRLQEALRGHGEGAARGRSA
ncbi:BTAD domain-containing putative transcriptional regulator [Nocardiopsis sp. RSe5-2]|uniref:BTAD domain-containing putative transcriptional regulator n=1 Tax=Nocardiopsis endophytica TaxID=3018445 RepID=A0ABT4UAE7_9ACTN|nr:BTAD domain-containing putative transcriptional regulator [Nocardiopsis endophytica]MDA2813941.1 BTAD domain-containing putative transcriptional regulator [Nocardiopsis endophytica]